MSTNENSANSIAAVLFDLDGTLLDTADDLGAALNHVLNTYKTERSGQRLSSHRLRRRARVIKLRVWRRHCTI